MLRATGARMPALAELGAGLEAARPAEPHWYLFHLAADTDTQGGGIGSALLAAGLARVDAEQAPPTSSASRARRLLRPERGFAGTGTVELDGGAVTLVTMSRSSEPGYRRITRLLRRTL